MNLNVEEKYVRGQLLPCKIINYKNFNYIKYIIELNKNKKEFNKKIIKNNKK